MKAVWKGQVVAESEATIVVEGNHYFPPDSVERKFLRTSTKKTVCPWKGEASYYTLAVNGLENESAAWFYPETKPAAAEIEGYVAFWRGVEIIE